MKSRGFCIKLKKNEYSSSAPIAPAKFSTNFVASKAKTKQYFEAAKDLLYQPGQAEQTGKVLFSMISRLS